MEKRRREQRQVIPFRAKVVEYDIQHHGKPERVGGINEGMKIIRCTISRVRGIQQYTVIPPSARAPNWDTGITSSCVIPSSAR